VEWLEILIPRQLEIIFEINGRLLNALRARFPGDEGRAVRASLIEEGPQKSVRMANLAIVGSHSTNGVAAIHSELLRTTTVRDLAETFRERFNNKTNGITPRRWLKLANPSLAETISAAIGDSWITDLSQLQKLRPLAADAAFRAEFLKAQRACKARFAGWLRARSDIIVDPDTIFDCQIKCIHEYKRQLLNALRIVVLYQRLRENPNLAVTPRTFIFAGKAAPAYQLAKVILDARYEKVREGGVVVSQAVLIAIGIDWDGRRQILAVEMANWESRSSCRRERPRPDRGVSCSAVRREAELAWPAS
jgi:starch phosphorylase